MDGSAFDRLTRTLAAASSRRRALGGALAGALGAAGCRGCAHGGQEEEALPAVQEAQEGQVQGQAS